MGSNWSTSPTHSKPPCPRVGCAIRVELAVRLFDAEQISLGGAAAIAGLSVSEIIDELGRRKIAVIRITPEEFDEELPYIQTLANRR